MRHVGHVAFAGGTLRCFFHSFRSCNLATCLRRRSTSRLSPRFCMMAERKDMTWIVLPVKAVSN